MNAGTHLTHLHTVTAAFEHDLGRTDPAAALPGLRWTVAELAAHLGEVHRWAALNAREGRRHDRRNVPELDDAPLPWYATSRRILLDTLAELDPEARCYTFQRDDKRVRFWHRRQLHETLVHLWDLRSATDPAPPAPAEVPAEVYADGVDELFAVFLPRTDRTTLHGLTAPLLLRAEDVDRGWLVTPDWTVHAVPAADPRPDATTVAGPVADLLLFAWNRIGPDRLTVRGDRAVVDGFTRSRVRP